MAPTGACSADGPFRIFKTSSSSTPATLNAGTTETAGGVAGCGVFATLNGSATGFVGALCDAVAGGCGGRAIAFGFSFFGESSEGCNAATDVSAGTWLITVGLIAGGVVATGLAA